MKKLTASQLNEQLSGVVLRQFGKWTIEQTTGGSVRMLSTLQGCRVIVQKFVEVIGMKVEAGR